MRALLSIKGANQRPLVIEPANQGPAREEGEKL
jgi:hypothetical protein